MITVYKDSKPRMVKEKSQKSEDKKPRRFQKGKILVLFCGFILLVIYSIINNYSVLLSIYITFLFVNILVCFLDNQEDVSTRKILWGTRFDLYDELKKLYTDPKYDIDKLQKKLVVLNAEIESGKYLSVAFSLSAAAISILCKDEKLESWLKTPECIVTGLGICILGCICVILQIDIGRYNSIKKDVIMLELQNRKDKCERQ